MTDEDYRSLRGKMAGVRFSWVDRAKLDDGKIESAGGPVGVDSIAIVEYGPKTRGPA